MTTFTPWSALAGGLLIGLAVSTLLLLNGRIAGISGIVGGVVERRDGDTGWRLAFVLGLMFGALTVRIASANAIEISIASSPMTLGLAGLLVGYGTSMGSGCTSGHGICGIARFSKRSLTATATFMAAGVVTTFVTRHLLAG